MWRKSTRKVNMGRRWRRKGGSVRCRGGGGPGEEEEEARGRWGGCFGNLPIKVKKEVLVKEFSKFGEIESAVRIRSIPLRGVIVHEYIVFNTDQSAEASLANNMAVIAGNHIRVDRAYPPRKKLKAENVPLYDNKRTAFVGNLPFDVKDEPGNLTMYYWRTSVQLI
ncbi:hypothetical protein F3Y22_tig00116996pilonHSYRG00268 [Hibiscus syriacus]|uniref:RRM domain-containing protein n=1 Tax=Hibiscus syriacus TaxID=106335 RepID=A0A6A2WFA5_HIBSY|nr:hypothetical protein F3Y22_tig00116996pilonHSYRG00268 [Hibiscus syriacus]